MRPSLVTPSTSSATSGPKAAFTSSAVVSVSSTESCSSAATTESVSKPRSTTRHATATGWLT